MRVTPGSDPAKVSVAPNSPSARASDKVVPEMMAGATMGKVTWARILLRDAPSPAAASAWRASRPRSAPSSASTRNGSETKTCASTTAAVENDRDSANHGHRDPMTPVRPNAASSARPPTTGGMVMGSTTATRSAPEKRRARDMATASGTPMTTTISAAIRLVRSDNPSAAAPASEATSSGTRAHGTFSARAATGTTATSSATAAGASTQVGGRRREAEVAADLMMSNLPVAPDRAPPHRGAPNPASAKIFRPQSDVTARIHVSASAKRCPSAPASAVTAMG